MCDVNSPSLVPEQLAAAVSLIRELAHAKREGDADALNEAAPLFDSVPGTTIMIAIRVRIGIRTD
jgi:hypothetical protein